MISLSQQRCAHDWEDRQARFDCSTPRSYLHWRRCAICRLKEELPLTPAQQELQDEEVAAVDRWVEGT